MVSSESLSGSAAPSPKKHGVTKPLSLAGPTEADIQRNVELEKFLRESELYESEEETSRREEVLQRLDEIVKQWVKQLTRQRGYSDQMVEDANSIIVTFGSYRLGHLCLQKYTTFGESDMHPLTFLKSSSNINFRR